MANFDNRNSIPQQVWYDQLHDVDDGSFSKLRVASPDSGIDCRHHHRTEMLSKQTYLRDKVLSPQLNRLEKMSKFVPLSPPASTPTGFEKYVKSFETCRPFNSTDRAAFIPLKNSPEIHARAPKMQKVEEVGGLYANGRQKAKQKMKKNCIKDKEFKIKEMMQKY